MYEKMKSDANKNVKFVSEYFAGGVLLDLGANIGEVSIRCANKFDRIWAVEANPETYAVLQKRIVAAKLDDKIKTWKTAVAGESGLTRFVSMPSHCSTGSTVRENKRFKNRPDYYQTVETISLGELIAHTNSHWIKMDIEGSEYECLEMTVFDVFIKGLIVEFHNLNTDNRARLISIFDKMEHFGFKVKALESYPNWTLATMLFIRV